MLDGVVCTWKKQNKTFVMGMRRSGDTGRVDEWKDDSDDDDEDDDNIAMRITYNN